MFFLGGPNMDARVLARLLRRLLRERAAQFAHPPAPDFEGAAAWKEAVRRLFDEAGASLGFTPVPEFPGREGAPLDAVWVDSDARFPFSLVMAHDSLGGLEGMSDSFLDDADLMDARFRANVKKVLVCTPRPDGAGPYRLPGDVERILHRLQPMDHYQRRSWFVLTLTPCPAPMSEEDVPEHAEPRGAMPRALMFDLWAGFRKRYNVGTFKTEALVRPRTLGSFESLERRHPILRAVEHWS